MAHRPGPTQAALSGKEGAVDNDLSAAQPRAPLGSARSWQLRLVRAANLTIATDPASPDLYRTRFEGAPRSGCGAG